MSTIFTTATTLVPRSDATIRVRKFKPQTLEEDKRFITAELLEFHPDMMVEDEKMQLCYAYVKASPELLLPQHRRIYSLCGQGYLQEPYIYLNALYIHDEDLQAMRAWCKEHGNRPLIVHPCPLPYPVYKQGTRVKVIAGSKALLDQTGTVTSSEDEYCRVRFDEGGSLRKCKALYLSVLA